MKLHYALIAIAVIGGGIFGGAISSRLFARQLWPANVSSPTQFEDGAVQFEDSKICWVADRVICFTRGYLETSLHGAFDVAPSAND